MKQQNLRGNRKLTQHQRNLIIEFALSQLLSGVEDSVIIDSILTDFAHLNLSPKQASACLADADQRFQKICNQEAALLIPLHLMMYEKIWEYFNEIGYIPGKLKALKAKERLAGFHQKQPIIKVKEAVTHTAPVETVKYDLNRLTPEQRERFHFLMNKAMS